MHEPEEHPHIPYNDVTTLNSRATGEIWSDWGMPRLVSSDTVALFSGITHNHQWIHEEPVRCVRESPYGGPIVHGLLLVALIPALLPDEGFTVAGNSVRIVRGFDKLRLPSHVLWDELVHARVRRMSAYPAPSGKGTVIERDIEVWSILGKKPAVVGRLKLQYF